MSKLRGGTALLGVLILVVIHETSIPLLPQSTPLRQGCGDNAWNTWTTFDLIDDRELGRTERGIPGTQKGPQGIDRPIPTTLVKNRPVEMYHDLTMTSHDNIAYPNRARSIFRGLWQARTLVMPTVRPARLRRSSGT